MSPGDYSLYKIWHEKYAGEYEELWFDVEVDGVPADKDSGDDYWKSRDPEMLRLHKRLTSKRVDVMARIGQVYDIYEFRQGAAASTAGQIMTYGRLCKSEWPELTFRDLVVVTDFPEAATLKYLEGEGVRIIRLQNPQEHQQQAS